MLTVGLLGSAGMHESPSEQSRGKGYRKARGKHEPLLERTRGADGASPLTSYQRAAWLGAGSIRLKLASGRVVWSLVWKGVVISAGSVVRKTKSADDNVTRRRG